MDKPVRKAVRCYLIKDNKVVAIKYKTGRKRGYYDIPGGKIEEGETPKQTAIREVMEETGLSISNPVYKGNIIIEYPNRIYDFDIFILNEFEGKIQEFQENKSVLIDINTLLDKKTLSTIIILDRVFIQGLIDNKYNFNMNIKEDEEENIFYLEYKLVKKWKIVY